jgi:hypothetical protein
MILLKEVGNVKSEPMQEMEAGLNWLLAFSDPFTGDCTITSTKELSGEQLLNLVHFLSEGIKKVGGLYQGAKQMD